MYLTTLLLIVGLGVGTGLEFEYHLSPPDKVFIRTKQDGVYEIQKIEYNGLETQIAWSSIYHMIDKLQPCTKHNFKITAVEPRNFRKKLVFHKEITTGIGDNLPIQIVNVTTDSTTIVATFNFTHIDCIDLIEISIPEYNLMYPYTNRNISERVVISGRTPCTKYNLVVSARISNHTYLLYKDTVSTSSVEIKPVQNIMFDTSKNLLTWHHDQLLSGPSCISKYTVILKTDSIHHQKYEIRLETTQSSYDLKRLWPCSVYNVVITPNDEDTLKRHFTFETQYEEPSEVEAITGVIKNSTVLEIKWDRPKKNYECASNYSITINGEVYQRMENTIVLQNREPCDSFDVSVCSSPGKTQNCVQKIFDFSNSVDIQVGNVSNITTKTANSITTITWDPPNFGSKCIKEYLVQLNDKPRFFRTNTISFDNLLPCIEYEVGIESYSGNKRIISAKSIYKFEIKPQTKPIQPSGPELVAVSSTSLTLKSEYHNPHDKCKIIIFRFICHSQLMAETLNVTVKSIDDKNKPVEATFNNLEPSTDYTCQVSVKNSELWSNRTPNKTFTTDVPFGAKIEFQVDAKIDSIRVSWKTIPMAHEKQILTIIKQNHNYEQPKNCIFASYQKHFEIQWFNGLEYNIVNLEPATNYSIQMEIHMPDGSKKKTNVIYSSTKSGDPPKVINAQVVNKTLDPRTVTIKWELPCQLNGTIHRINLEFNGSGINDHTIPIDIEEPDRTYFFTDTLVEPDYRYNVSITTERNQTDSLSSDPVIVEFLAPPKLPPVYKLDDWASITADTDSEIQIFLYIKPSRRAHFNSVHNTSVLITNLDECGSLKPAYRVYDLDQNVYESNMLSHQNCIKEYRTYSVSFNYMIHGCIVEQNNCKQPLNPGRSYQILMRSYTSNGFADTNPIVFHTASETDATLILVSNFLVCLTVVIGLGAMLWFYNYKIKKYPKQIITKLIDVKNFTDYYAHLDPNVITDEFAEISRMDLSRIPQSIGLKHRKKNRYIDILPYDFNRVVLTPNEYHRDVSGYINASYINGFKHKNKFIATQGPTDNTAYDFWRMVIENKSCQIVMVTQLIENEVNKCFQYYPNFNEQITFNDLTIKNVNETDMKTFIRRALTISQGSTQRLVIHYQFNKWPDHGCPENEMDLIKFVEFIRNENSSPEPIVVHCSAGVGRTGTFITLDILMDEMKRNYIDICLTVRQLRKQRVKSVQTIEQYKFVYACIDQYVKQLQSTD